MSCAKHKWRNRKMAFYLTGAGFFMTDKQWHSVVLDVVFFFCSSLLSIPSPFFSWWLDSVSLEVNKQGLVEKCSISNEHTEIDSDDDKPLVLQWRTKQEDVDANVCINNTLFFKFVFYFFPPSFCLWIYW